jgi:hypothetical protein
MTWFEVSQEVRFNSKAVNLRSARNDAVQTTVETALRFFDIIVNLQTQKHRFRHAKIARKAKVSISVNRQSGIKDREQSPLGSLLLHSQFKPKRGQHRCQRFQRRVPVFGKCGVECLPPKTGFARDRCHAR